MQMNLKNSDIVNPLRDLNFHAEQYINFCFPLFIVYESYLHTCLFLLQKRSQDAAGGHYLAK